MLCIVAIVDSICAPRCQLLKLSVCTSTLLTYIYISFAKTAMPVSVDTARYVRQLIDVKEE